MTTSTRRVVLTLASIVSLVSVFAATRIADAQTATPVVSFMTVDSYGYSASSSSTMQVTGAIQTATGVQAGARSLQFGSTTDAMQATCEHAMIQAINRPGRVRVDVYGFLNSSGTTVNQSRCVVVRLP